MLNLRHALLASALMLTACMPAGLPGLVEGALNASTGNNSSSSNTSANSSASANASGSASLPDPLEIATLSGLKASSCSEEGTIRSANGEATNIKFSNNAEGRVTVYWLDRQGSRVEYKKLAKGESYTQPTFVTHPWLIANDQDQCLGIYLPEQGGTVSVDVKKTVSVANSGSTANLSAVTEANITEERARQGAACLTNKGLKTQAGAVEAAIGLYVQMKGTFGAEIAKQGYLTGVAKLLNDHGC
ncbi:MAG: hypothetical protein IGS03_06335 [Candidatus Sericytochromatia bacterium]|nr:hypothetical protein [Candidatus Sericytochromatia bacterium]